MQDACDLVDSRGAAALSPAHTSMVRVVLNRAICLVGSASNEGTAIFPTTPASSSSGAGAGVPSWRNRDFMFNSYPRLLAAARKFDYPLQVRVMGMGLRHCAVHRALEYRTRRHGLPNHKH